MIRISILSEQLFVHRLPWDMIRTVFSKKNVLNTLLEATSGKDFHYWRFDLHFHLEYASKIKSSSFQKLMFVLRSSFPIIFNCVRPALRTIKFIFQKKKLCYKAEKFCVKYSAVFSNHSSRLN